MFYMQYKGREKAAKVVEFVAKWLNLCLSTVFEKSESNNGITRSAGLNKLKTVFKSKIRENSFTYPSVQLWNSAPPEIATETRESRVRIAIRNYVKTLPI